MVVQPVSAFGADVGGGVKKQYAHQWSAQELHQIDIVVNMWHGLELVLTAWGYNTISQIAEIQLFTYTDPPVL